MSGCNHHITDSSVYQTLEELDFERGIWFAAQYGDTERVLKLLSQGVPVNIQDSAGYTALHYSSRNGHLSTCRCLLQAGASVNYVTRAGLATPLHRAVTMNHMEVVKMLLESGADINKIDADGMNVLHRSVKLNLVKMTELLLNCEPQLKNFKDGKDYFPCDYIDKSNESLAALFK